jgi:colanic acid/amylovoran biosynthesis glycosyltransferase
MASVRKTHAKHVVTFYGYDVNRLPVSEVVWRERYRALFANVDCVLCEGPYMASQIAQLGCPTEKLRVHPLGVETRKIRFQPRRWCPGTKLRVMIAATFTEKKGIPDALAALALLKEQLPLEITIIGDARPYHPADQREKERILSAIKQYRLTSRVRLLGYQPHQIVFEEAYRHHIFLSPSITASDGDTEGGAPASIIEMAATGMPVIGTRHCDIPSVVHHGSTGFLADEGDVETLAAYVRMLAYRLDLWEPIVRRGREHIERNFDASLQGARLASIYESILL